MELQNKCKTNSILEWRFREKGREVKFGAYVHTSETITIIEIMNTLIVPRSVFRSLCNSFFLLFSISPPQATTVLFSVRTVWFAFSKILGRWSHTLCTVIWLLSFSILILRFIQVTEGINSASLVWINHNEQTHLLVEICFFPSVFDQLQIELLHSYMNLLI